jgi:adenylate kinase family enzyme
MDLEAKHLLEDIKKAFEGHTDNVVETIKATVNGKIDRLNQSVLLWQKEEAEKRNIIEQRLNEYMETTKPMIEFFEDITSSKRVLFWILGGFATIGAFYLMIREIFIR